MPDTRGKWIQEVHDVFYEHNEIGDLDAVDEILDIVDSLLFKVALDVNSSSLHDDIMKLLKRGTNE